jgi:hypothetical protein
VSNGHHTRRCHLDPGSHDVHIPIHPYLHTPSILSISTSTPLIHPYPSPSILTHPYIYTHPYPSLHTHLGWAGQVHSAGSAQEDKVIACTCRYQGSGTTACHNDTMMTKRLFVSSCAPFGPAHELMCQDWSANNCGALLLLLG